MPKQRDYNGSSYSICADPNPINISNSASAGSTTISWETRRNIDIEIHIGAPDGPIFCSSGTSGSASTGDWVEDGMTFYLQNASKEKSLVSENTLATVTVRVIKGKKAEWLRTPLSWIRKKFEAKGLIFMYHRISEIFPDPWRLNVTPEHFAEHLHVLKKNGFPMQLREIANAIKKKNKLPKKWFVITLDDGYADNLKSAKPILEHYDFPATIFLTTSALDGKRKFWWDELEGILLQPGALPEKLLLNIGGKEHKWDIGKWAQYGQADFYKHRNWCAEENDYPTSRHLLYVSLHKLLHPLIEYQRQEILDRINIWAEREYICQPILYPLSNIEVLQLSKSKLIDLGSHTVTHVNLSRVPVDVQRNEIQTSKKYIENLIGQRIFSFSYPHGAYGSETMAIVKDAGYNCACSNTRGIISKSTNRFLLPRIHVVDCDGEVFERNLWGWLKQLDIVRN